MTYVDGKPPWCVAPMRGRFTSIAAIDQPGMRVVVNSGGTNEEFARANIHAAGLRVHPGNTTVFDETREGRADVMATDSIEVDHQAAMHPDLCPAHVPAPFTRLEKAYLLQNDAELVSEVNAAGRRGGERGVGPHP